MYIIDDLLSLNDKKQNKQPLAATIIIDIINLT